jgi:hypothetical protein
MKTSTLNQHQRFDTSQVAHFGVLQGLGTQHSAWYLVGFSGLINEYRDQYGNRCLLNPRNVKL